ncbi:MAG TPA: sigma-70 family RNA polymerase sigma factor, partial [Planctomycetota bacterium]|nr:sigma-70 family RNA polymerase sigma factor [Planctomycetota bacterium]
MRPLLEAELTAHAHALRALARLLVGEGHADDLVQDTALQALQSPPSRAAGLRGWLSQVLRRLASNHHRGRSRRQRREQLVEPPRPPEPAARVAEHHEAVQRVTAALLGLPEPYHGTLLLRFFEELTPTAIAQVTGVPLATVKSRLQRGLALLRERLDAEAKGKDWRPALAAAFGVPQAAAVGAAVVVSTGVLLMGSGVKLAVGGVAAAAA